MESTLSLRFKDFTGEVGSFLGYGAGADQGDTAWDARTQAKIEAVVASGLRQFYFPPPMEPGGVSYEWSFLQPALSLILREGARTVNLPEDFGGIQGPLFVTTTGQVPVEVEVWNTGEIDKLYAEQPDATGSPEKVALQTLKMPEQATTVVLAAGQRVRLYFFPESDDDYTLVGSYYILPAFLDGKHEFAYGGMAHHETILESCLAIAEQRLDDAATVHSAKFMERLAASVSLDRRLKPQKFGLNLDRSDAMGWGWRDRHGWPTVATFDGTAYP